MLSPPEDEDLLVDLRRLSLLPRAPFECLKLTEDRRLSPRFVSVFALVDARRFLSSMLSPPEDVDLLVDLRKLSLLPRAPFERLKLTEERRLSLLPRFSERRSLLMSLSLVARFSALPRVVELRKLPSLPLRRIR